GSGEEEPDIGGISDESHASRSGEARLRNMTSEERRVVLELLDSGQARLLELTAGLSPAQWHFQETPERWSIAGNIEHMVVFENFILGVLQDLMRQPAEPEKA